MSKKNRNKKKAHSPPAKVEDPVEVVKVVEPTVEPVIAVEEPIEQVVPTDEVFFDADSYATGEQDPEDPPVIDEAIGDNIPEQTEPKPEAEEEEEFQINPFISDDPIAQISPTTTEEDFDDFVQADTKPVSPQAPPASMEEMVAKIAEAHGETIEAILSPEIPMQQPLCLDLVFQESEKLFERCKREVVARSRFNFETSAYKQRLLAMNHQKE